MNHPRVYIYKTDVSTGIYYEVTPIRRVYLDLIAYCEGTDKVLDQNPIGYDILFGGGRIKSLTKHPQIHVPFGHTTSTAAGRYQVMDFTEKLILKALSFPPNKVSFSPEAQDQRALWLVHVKRNALKYVDSDDLTNFLKLCSWEWASLPPSRYGQGYLTQRQVLEAYYQLKHVHDIANRERLR